MTKTMKTIITSTMALGLLVGFTGCGNTYSDELVQQKVIKKNKMDKHFENVKVESEFAEKTMLLGSEVEIYNYTVEGTVSQGFCKGFRSPMSGRCSGREYTKGEVVKAEGKVTMTPMDQAK